MLLSSFFIFSLVGDELTVDPPLIWDADCLSCKPPAEYPYPFCEIDQQVVVDLLNPTYEDGVLTTVEGGTLTAPELRVQAKKIVYTRNLDHDPPIFTVCCEGDLLIDYREWTLVGDILYYDFLTHSGYLINGKTASPPWYVGGDEILLFPEGNLIAVGSYLTTSEGANKEVLIRSPKIELTPNKVISASNISFKVKKIPFFWFPKFKFDLNNLGRSPLAVKFGWGGFTGSHLSLLYRFLSWGEFHGTARLDGFFTQGVGGGIETAYNPKFSPTRFYTRNYYASDIALDNRFRRDRYRFQGTFFDRWCGITTDGIYDFVSDGQMAADYQTKDFELKTAGRTQIEFRKECENWIANLFTRVRVNDFQSVNQELPSFYLHWHPVEIPSTGIIVENTMKASYLHYIFSQDVIDGRNFHAGRVATHPRLYRPIYMGSFTATPEAGFIGIGYSNSPEGKPVGQAVGEVGLNLETAVSKCGNCWKHVIEPYAHYRHLTTPSVGNDRHFIFTINDGLNHLDLIRFGVRNLFFTNGDCGIDSPLWADLWANAFFNSANIPDIIPKAYLNVEWHPHTRMFLGLEAAWNFQQSLLDFYNARVDWTFSEHLAWSFEYRYRSRYDWRKADFYNFILETVRSVDTLLVSPLSNRRETILFKTFLRFTPDVMARFSLRSGWNWFGNLKQPSYLEYQIDLSTIIFDHWRLMFMYEKREADNRYSVSLKLDPGPPTKGKACK